MSIELAREKSEEVRRGEDRTVPGAAPISRRGFFPARSDSERKWIFFKSYLSRAIQNVYGIMELWINYRMMGR